MFVSGEKEREIASFVIISYFKISGDSEREKERFDNQIQNMAI